MFASPVTLRFVPTPQAGADAWAAGVSAATQKWSDRIQSTNKDQAGRAVAQQGSLVANFNQAVNSGLWANRLMAVGTAGWKAASKAKAANYGTAATAGKDRYAQAASQLYPYEEALAAQIDNMPAGGAANAKARAGAWIDGMIAFKQQYRP